ncbi:MAG: hypothetical protein BGN95_21905 [Sphingomonas sp. 66-10]|nr:MAG: hypothetical protein BGN95_21905 [Sphingomonas sp. 66-10]
MQNGIAIGRELDLRLLGIAQRLIVNPVPVCDICRMGLNGDAINVNALIDDSRPFHRRGAVCRRDPIADLDLASGAEAAIVSWPPK